MYVKTTILDRFMLDKMKQMQRNESYLPTQQALPEKLEFTYLPNNTQEEAMLFACSYAIGLKELISSSIWL